MSYLTLRKYGFSHIDDVEAEYLRRFNDKYAVHINFDISGSAAFFLITPEIMQKTIEIYKLNNRIINLRNELPHEAIRDFAEKCLVNEIIASNNIEGVSSTRQEVQSAIKLNDIASKKHSRFGEVVNKYLNFFNNQWQVIKNCEDVRQLYIDTFYSEVLREHPDYVLDGNIFRKNSAVVIDMYSDPIHHGLSPETKIIEAMNKALAFVNDDSITLLYRVAAFHYFFGYIHPFYDGNGRTSRLISANLLTTEFDTLLAVRLSYTINQNKAKYENAFKECNELKNKGEITNFIEMFLSIVDESMESLWHALKRRSIDWDYYEKGLQYLPDSEKKFEQKLYWRLLVASLYSDEGISVKGLVSYTSRGNTTVRKVLSVLNKLNLISIKKVEHENMYSLNLNTLKKYIDEHDSEL